MQANHILREGLKAAQSGPPVKPGKSTFVAFLAGFFFGPLGTGLYLETFEDFFVPLCILLAATFLTAGIAAPVAWMFCGAWGAMRVSESNRKARNW